MDKNIDVSFSYGDKDFNKITKMIVLRKLNLYKEKLRIEENHNEISQESIENQQFLGRHEE